MRLSITVVYPHSLGRSKASRIDLIYSPSFIAWLTAPNSRNICGSIDRPFIQIKCVVTVEQKFVAPTIAAIGSMRIFECVANFCRNCPKKRLHKFRHFFDRPGPLAGALDTQKNVFLTDCIGRSPLCQLILISHESFHFLGLKKKSQPVHSFDNTPTGYHCRVVSAEVFLFLGPTTCRCVPPGVARVVQAAEQHFEKRNKKNVFGHFVGDCAFVR